MPPQRPAGSNSLSVHTGDDLSSIKKTTPTEQVISGYSKLFGETSALAKHCRALRRYFDDPTALSIAQSRLRQIPNLLDSARFEQLAIKAQGSPLLLDAIFLIAVRGNLKELVYSEGAATRQELDQNGFKSEKIANLLDATVVKTALNTVLTDRLLSTTQDLSNHLLFTTGYSLNQFSDRDDLVAIFSDDIAGCLRAALQKRASALKPTHRDYPTIQGIAESLGPVTSGALSVELVSRNRSCLIGGELSGDCTAPGSFNSWTLGPWSLTLENFELRFSHNSDFFARTVNTAGYRLDSSGNKHPIIWTHAIEFTPLSRRASSGSRFANLELQQQLFQDLVSFKSRFAGDCGCSHSFLTTISNSFGFSQILSSLLKTAGPLLSIATERHQVLLPGPLHSAHGIRRIIHPEFYSKDVGIVTLLQGCPRSSFKLSTPAFEPKQSKERNEDVPSIQGITEQQLNALSRLFVSKVEDELKECRSRLEILNGKTYRTALRQAVMLDNPERKLRGFFNKAAKAALPIVAQLDPGIASEVQREFTQAYKQAVRNCTNIKLKAAMTNVDISSTTISQVISISKKVLQELDVAAEAGTLRTPQDITNVVTRSIPIEQSATLPDEDEELSLFYSSAEDEYEDLLDSLSVDQGSEPSAERNDFLIGCLEQAVASSLALDLLLNGQRLSPALKREILEHALCSYFIGDLQQLNLETPEALSEIDAIFQHTSKDSKANFWIRRPSEWCGLYKRLKGFLEGASYAQRLDSHAYVALANRLKPSLLDTFAAAIAQHDNVLLGLSSAGVQAVMDNLATLVDFYKYSSTSTSRAETKHSLLCNVRGFTIAAAD